jgi:hypothetical protein
MNVSRVFVVAGLIVSTSACSTQPTSPRIGTVKSADILTDHEAEIPGGPPAMVDWTVPVTLKGTYDAGTQLSATVSNYLSTSQQVHVYLTATGLDQRKAQRDLGYVTVPAATAGGAGGPALVAGTATITTTFSQAPVQSIGIQSELELQVVYHETLTDQIIANSSPLYYSFTNTRYTTVNSYGWDGTDFAITTPPGIGGVDLLNDVSNSASGIYAAVGRYYTASSGWHNVNLPTPPTNTFSALQSYLVNGQRNYALDGFDWLDHLPVEQTTPASGANTYSICTTWRAEYIDNQPLQFGAIDPLSNVQDIAARFSAFVIEGPNHEWVAKGFLDGNGCTMGVALDPTKAYSLWQTTQLQANGSDNNPLPRLRIQYGGWDPNYINYVPEVWGQTPTWSALEITAFTVAPVSSTTSHNITPTGEDVNINAAAHAGRILNQPVQLGLSGLGSVPLIIYGNILANDGSTGFFLPPTNNGQPTLLNPTNPYGVWLGPSQYTPHNSKYQSIIAHEFGHQVNLFKMGLSNFSLGLASGNSACRCDQVVDPLASSHCLQSLVGNGFAVNEGFAHFFSASVVNAPTLSSCTFMYYKEFRNDDSTITKPPMPKSCVGAVQWETNHCGQSANTIEWDWMNFWWRINNDTTSPISIDDIAAVYKQSCGGVNCWKTPAPPAQSFSSLNSAAAVVLSVSQQTSFSQNGINYGINY